MKITCISDLHGHFPKLNGGDLLIIAGDLTARDTPSEYLAWREWLRKQPYKKKVFTCGNHDGCIANGLFYFSSEWLGAEFLNDSGTEFEGLKIWGSPWTKTFPDMNRRCKAYTVDTEKELEEKWSLIPSDIDILITHSPPFNILDEIEEVTKWGTKQFNVGSKSLLREQFRINPKIHVFGHIHECGGMKTQLGPILCINASHVNRDYEPVNPPIEVEI